MGLSWLSQSQGSSLYLRRLIFFFLSNGLEKHFFKENLGSLKMDSMKNGFHVWKNNFRSVLALLWMEMSLNLVSLHSNEVNKLIDVWNLKSIGYFTSYIICLCELK